MNNKREKKCYDELSQNLKNGFIKGKQNKLELL